MEDMYQYAASAVESNNNNNNNKQTNTVPEEEDVIIKAFTNMGWGKKWSSLVDTVKKQSEAFVEGTKKDLQEIAQVLTEDDETTVAEQESREIDLNPMDAIRENLARINTVNFTSLRDGLTHTLNQTLPSQITSVRLPENMDLTQLKEGLTNGTRSAEQYLQNFGTDVIAALKNTVTVLGPEEQQQQEQENIQRSASPRIFASRKEALIAKMQTNENTYLIDPSTLLKDQEQERKVLETFNASFKIDEYTDEISQLLNDYPDLRQTMDKLVPVQVSYTLFWQRYFYQAWKIDQDEQKRQMIVQGVTEDEGDFKWDSDEEENTMAVPVASTSTATITTKDIKQESRTSQDTDDFSNISEPMESPALKSSQTTEDEWVKAEKKKSDDDESDSDWE